MQESIKLPEVGIVSGLAISQAANKALETIATHFMGDAEPNPTYPLMMWGQPSAGRMWQRNSANSAWIDRGPLDVEEAGYSTVASAASPDIWSGGETINYTGTVTCTGFPAAPYVGAKRTLLIASYGAKFTLGTNVTMDGFSSGYTYNCYAGMIVEVVALTTTTFRLHVRPYAAQWSLPTHYNTTNVAASTNSYGHFSIIRDTVSFSYGFYVDPTTAGIQTILGVALGEGAFSPPASAFAGIANGGGVAANAANNASGVVYPDAATGRLLVEMYPPSAANAYWKMSGHYRML